MNDDNNLSLWRIICTYQIVALHWGYYSSGWKLAVEFFFITSGILLAYEHDVKNTPLRYYIKKRICRLYPHYLFSYIVFIAVSALQERWDAVRIFHELGESILEIGMLQILGIGNLATNHGAVWYVSALFISSIVLYMILTLIPERICFIIFIIFWSVYYFSQFYFGSLCIVTWESKYGVCLIPGLLRGFGEVSLGIICYYLGIKLKKIGLYSRYRVQCIVLEYILMAVIIIYSRFYLDNQIFIIMFYSMVISVSFFTEHRLPVGIKKMFAKISTYTYAIYLNHPLILILFRGYSLLGTFFIVTGYSIITQKIISKICFRREFN